MEDDKKQENAEASLPREQLEQTESFQELIRGRYREEYLQALAQALQAQARQADRYLAYRELCFAAERAKLEHPGFDLMQELEDPGFARLIENGVDPAVAYEAVHRQEQQRAEAARARNAAHPQENGLGRDAAAAFRPDPRRLTPEQRRSLRRRAARGEQIVW